MRTDLVTTSTQISSRTASGAPIVVIGPRLKMTAKKRAHTHDRLNRSVERKEPNVDDQLAELDLQERLDARTYISTEEYGNVEDHHQLISFGTGQPQPSKAPRKMSTLEKRKQGIFEELDNPGYWPEGS